MCCTNLRRINSMKNEVVANLHPYHTRTSICASTLHINGNIGPLGHDTSRTLLPEYCKIKSTSTSIALSYDQQVSSRSHLAHRISVLA